MHVNRYIDWCRRNVPDLLIAGLTLGTILELALTCLVEEAGVMILPESIFEHGGNHFRIGFGRRTMPEALERFEAYLDETLVNAPASGQVR